MYRLSLWHQLLIHIVNFNPGLNTRSQHKIRTFMVGNGIVGATMGDAIVAMCTVCRFETSRACKLGTNGVCDGAT